MGVADPGRGRATDPLLVAGPLGAGGQPLAGVVLPRHHPEDRHLHQRLGVAAGGVGDVLLHLGGDLVVRDPLAEPLRLGAERDLGQQPCGGCRWSSRTAPTPGRRTPCRRPRGVRPAGWCRPSALLAARRWRGGGAGRGGGGRAGWRCRRWRWRAVPARTAAVQASAVRARRRPGRGRWITTLLEKRVGSLDDPAATGRCPGNRSGLTERPSPIGLCASGGSASRRRGCGGGRSGCRGRGGGGRSRGGGRWRGRCGRRGTRGGGGGSRSRRRGVGSR